MVRLLFFVQIYEMQVIDVAKFIHNFPIIIFRDDYLIEINILWPINQLDTYWIYMLSEKTGSLGNIFRVP